MEIEIEGEGEAYFEVDLGQRGIVHIKAEKFEKVNVDTINARFGSNLTLKAIQQSKVVHVQKPLNPNIFTKLHQYSEKHANTSASTMVDAEDMKSTRKMQNEMVKGVIYNIFMLCIFLEEKNFTNPIEKFISLQDIKVMSKAMLNFQQYLHKRFILFWHFITNFHKNQYQPNSTVNYIRLRQQLVLLWRIILSKLINKQNNTSMRKQRSELTYQRGNKICRIPNILDINPNYARTIIGNFVRYVNSERNLLLIKAECERNEVSIEQAKTIFNQLIAYGQRSFLVFIDVVEKITQVRFVKSCLVNFLEYYARKKPYFINSPNPEGYIKCAQLMRGYILREETIIKQVNPEIKKETLREAKKNIRKRKSQTISIDSPQEPKIKVNHQQVMNQDGAEDLYDWDELNIQVKRQQTSEKAAIINNQIFSDHCVEHPKRIVQCFCIQCRCFICPTCLISGSHFEHKYSSIEAEDLREKMNRAAKSISLIPEKAESVLPNIHRTKQLLKKDVKAILQGTEDCFNKLKTKFLEKLHGYYNKQRFSIKQSEEKWREKQKVSQQILKLQTEKDDRKLREEAGAIIMGLEALAKPVEDLAFHPLKKLGEALARQDVDLDKLQTALKQDLAQRKQAQ